MNVTVHLQDAIRASVPTRNTAVNDYVGDSRHGRNRIALNTVRIWMRDAVLDGIRRH